MLHTALAVGMWVVSILLLGYVWTLVLFPSQSDMDLLERGVISIAVGLVLSAFTFFGMSSVGVAFSPTSALLAVLIPGGVGVIVLKVRTRQGANHHLNC